MLCCGTAAQCCCGDLAPTFLAGIILDPVYTGKALHGLLGEMAADPEAWRGRRVLFVHTGGLLGCYDKAGELQPLVEGLGRTERMAVVG